jgi:hypothetical protein
MRNAEGLRIRATRMTGENTEKMGINILKPNACL